MSKLAVVTGASGALGSAIVTALLDADYAVLACGRTLDRLGMILALTMRGMPVWPWVFDLTTATSEILSARLARWEQSRGPVDVLVCAHGAPPCTTPTLALSLSAVDTVYRTDVLGTLVMAQAVGAQMVARQCGAMVFLSSAHSHQTYPARIPYVLSKTAVVGLARALAVEWGSHNITVNSISPWQVAGETRSTTVAAHEGDDTESLYRARAPLGRLVTRADVAATVLWLAQTRSVTGQDIRVDCGVSTSMWHRPFPVVALSEHDDKRLVP